LVVGSIAEAVRAKVDGRQAVSVDRSGDDIDEKQFVIAGGVSSNDAAIEMGQGVGQNGRGVGTRSDRQAGECRLTGSEAFAKMGDELGLALRDDIDDAA
jgi:hypothetical protein